MLKKFLKMEVDNSGIVFWSGIAMLCGVLWMSYYGLTEEMIESNYFALSMSVVIFSWTCCTVILIKGLLSSLFYKKLSVGLSLENKALLVIKYYIYLIILVAVINVILAIPVDFIDRLDEIKFYSDQVDNIKNEFILAKNSDEYENVNIEIEPYVRDGYFINRKYQPWKDIDLVLEVYKLEDETFIFSYIEKEVSLVDQKLIEPTDEVNEKSTYFDYNNEQFLLIILEDIYYAVQTVSTLGFGNIIANHPSSMIISIIAVLIGQLITIFGIALIVRD